jgi:polyferredoxin
MSRFQQPTLVRYSSIAVDQGEAARPLRPRTLVYGGLLTALTAVAMVLLLGRVPFEASVNRAPGSLFTVDADGYVRNTYLIKVTNKESASGAVVYQVQVDGLEGAVLTTSELRVDAEGSTTVPLIVRLPVASADRRTIPFTVRVRSASSELLLPTTFKTGASVGGEDD